MSPRSRSTVKLPEFEVVSTYKNDMRDATRDATPQTITVALVRLDPVPLPGVSSGISRFAPTSRVSVGEYETLLSLGSLSCLSHGWQRMLGCLVIYPRQTQ